MHPEKNANNGRRTRRVVAMLGFLLLLLTSAMIANAQSAQSPAQELKMSDIMRLPGRVVAESKATKAVGLYKVQNYRVEEVDLPQATTVEIGGERVETKKAFRIRISGGPFPVRALPPVIWIDDVAVGYGVEDEDLTSITALTFDSSLLRNGATIYLSYGDKGNKEDRTALPVRLNLSGAQGGQQ